MPPARWASCRHSCRLQIAPKCAAPRSVLRKRFTGFRLYQTNLANPFRKIAISEFFAATRSHKRPERA
jgi:hypothetical protein